MGSTVISNILSNVQQPTAVTKGVIIPLYIYPSWWVSPGAWDFVYNAALNYPSVTFTVVINPDSGPGSAAIPNSDYQHEIIRLRSVANIQLLGYVDTAYGSRAASAVANDVSLYAGWGTMNPQLAMDGIFFDNQATGAQYVSQYYAYASQVRSSSFGGSKTVGFAPGGICNPAYVDIADFVVIFEQASSVVSGDIAGWYSGFIGGLSLSQLSKISWILNGADSTTPQAIANLQAAFNTKYLYATDMSGWQTFVNPPSSALLSKFLGMINQPITQALTLL